MRFIKLEYKENELKYMYYCKNFFSPTVARKTRLRPQTIFLTRGYIGGMNF